MPFPDDQALLAPGRRQAAAYGQVSNWTGKALAAPRTELDDLLARDELESSGVSSFSGLTRRAARTWRYIGEAEVIRDRLKRPKAKDFWNSIVVFVSKDENLTKAHIRYLENRRFRKRRLSDAMRSKTATQAIRSCRSLTGGHGGLPFAARKLPISWFYLLSPIWLPLRCPTPSPLLFCRLKTRSPRCRRTESGFVVFSLMSASDHPASR